MPPETCDADRPRKRVRTAAPQPVEVLLAKLCDIVGPGIDPALEPIPVAALLDLAACQMEDDDGARQHALNALIGRAAVGGFPPEGTPAT